MLELRDFSHAEYGKRPVVIFHPRGKRRIFKGRPTLCVRRTKNTTSIVIPTRPHRLRNARNKPI